jgi:quinol monooxygenase YgiN
MTSGGFVRDTKERRQDRDYRSNLMTGKKITVLALIKAGAGKEEQLRLVLESLIEPTRREAGCINYDLHRREDDQAVFMFYENWSSREAWEKHMETDHLRGFKDKAAELLAEAPDVTVWEMV